MTDLFLTWRRRLPGAMIAVLLAAWAAPSLAHDHPHRRGDYTQTYWDGACKVERKWKRNGQYKEKRKCRPAYAYPQAVHPQTVYGPPAIVIQPPPIILRP
ncbi:hypothetical protein CAL22_16785 [Bordetella genomosp. 12]|uniref:Uncharacterized protein n=2 Tax=Bordetella genomosp. 12 TaxID=463035 RepID=A0A261VDV3_9BORD|nr:hypothetical protein CAL22_16785 [Bordetella genomosp. 12]